jgi:DNA-binding response OmpR family regulator
MSVPTSRRARQARGAPVTAPLALRGPSSDDALEFLQSGPIAVWPAQYVALVGTRRVALTKGEGAMLLTMIAARGAPVRRSELAAVWGARRVLGGRSVDTRVYMLRKKLGDDARDPRLIVTVSGVGYAIHVDLVAEGRGDCRPSVNVQERTTRGERSRYTRAGGTSRTGAA